MPRIFIVAIVVYLVAPLVINGINLAVNRNDIKLYSRTFSRYAEIKQKDLFFLDGRFVGLEKIPENLYGFKGLENPDSKDYFYTKRLECRINPKDTVFRVLTFKYDASGGREIISNVSFSGKLKDEILEHNITYDTLLKMYGKFAEKISDIKELDSLQ